MLVQVKKNTIIMVNMSRYSEWESGIRNRNYFILHELLKRNEVEKIIALDYLPVQYKKKIRYVKDSVFNSNANPPLIAKTRYTRAYQYAPKLTVISSISPKDAYRVIQSMLFPKSITQKHILWSYFPLLIDYYQTIPADITVFDTVDDWSAHPSYHSYKDRLRKNYQKICGQVDVIFTVSEHLQKHIFHERKNVFWIPNGVEIKKNICQKKNLKKPKKNIVGYVGTIQSRVDFDLIQYSATRNLDKQFVFIGPVWDDANVDKVKNLTNVYFRGAMPYEDARKYMSQFSVAIIPHKVDAFTKSMDPMKFYEYLSCGVPVVSTHCLNADTGLYYFAPDYSDFSEALEKAITENSEDKMVKRITFAEKNSWEHRVSEMLKIIIGI